MEPTWIVVADQSQAHLYRVSGTPREPELEPVDTLDHSIVREKLDPSESGAKLSFYDASGPADEEQRRFARRVISRLKQEQQRGEFRRLVIAAPAGFMGTLRGLYGSSLATSVGGEIIGDYTRESRHALASRMRKARWLHSS